MRRRDFKILWMSNAPFAPTGYGTVTKNVVYRLLKQGFNIRTVNYYGTEGGVLTLNGLMQYPKAFDQYGKDAAELAIADFNPQVFVTLFDCWVGSGWLDTLHPKWVAYTPVDHFPLMPPVTNIVKRAYRVVAMSRYAESQFKQHGIECDYIPHGVNTRVFKPMEDKGEAKDWVNQISKADQFSKHKILSKIDKDSFVVGINAANKGPRKDISRMLLVCKLFLEQNPDAEKDFCIYLHTWIRGVMRGFHLDDLGSEMGMLPYMRWTPIVKMFTGLSEPQLNMIYNSFDVFMNLAQGEGFGLPILEAQACQVPCIVTDFTSMTELVKDHGWLVPYKDLHYTPLNATQCFADEWKAVDALSEAYNSEEKRKEYGVQSQIIATILYDYEKCILPLWVDFFDEMLADGITNYELQPEPIPVQEDSE